MKKSIITIIVLIIIFTITGFIINTKTKQKNITNKLEEISKIEKEFKNLDINYEIYNMPPELSNYLKTKSKYKKLYKTKKFVVYIDGTDSPYSEEFKQNIQKIIKTNKKHYTFVSRKSKNKIITMKSSDMKIFKRKGVKIDKGIISEEEGNAELTFLKKCSSICIINPETNQMFSIKGSRQKEAEQLDKIFDTLKKW